MNLESALILAGGKSTRMGYDKKRLALNGVGVMERLIEGLGALFSEVLVSSNEPFVHEKVRVLPDTVGAGPLAGIYQGLLACKSPYLYVTACDMPFLSAAYIRYIRDIVRAGAGFDACVARRADGLYEPFNSFFGKTCLTPIYDALMRREYKISRVLDRLNLHVVEASTVEQYQEAMFFNINYQEDLADANQIADNFF